MGFSLFSFVDRWQFSSVMGGYCYTGDLMAMRACTPITSRVYDADWSKVVTPLRALVWERKLASHPDREFAHWVCEGVREGFRLGFDYRRCHCRSAGGNMRSVIEHREVVESYVQGEREAGRLLGPWVQVSPFGVIPKKDPGKWRLICDLSSPCGASVNDGIDGNMCSVCYLRIDEVVDKVVQVGQGALLAKFDLKSAYRNVPVHPEDRWLLGMILDDQLYVDRVTVWLEVSP